MVPYSNTWALFIRQVEVRNHGVNLLLCQEIRPQVDSPAQGDHFHAQLLEYTPQNLPDDRVIIHNQNAERL